MAKVSVGYSYSQVEGDVLYDDIWSQKARHRMSTARERKALTFTTSMSAEATMAMQQLTTSASKPQISKAKTKGKRGVRKTVSKDQGLSNTERIQEAKHVCSVKLSDVYDKLGVEQKLDGDITDPSTWDEGATKFVLGGGKMENAMEIVEIVNADDPKPQVIGNTGGVDDEHAVAEIARINSINKCNVWFEAHESLLEPSEPTASCNEPQEQKETSKKQFKDR